MKQKQKTLQELIKAKKFDWVNPNITLDNFPPEILRSNEYKVYHFDRYISSEDAIKEMGKEGYSPANIYELLSWKDWNGEDSIVALGSVAGVGDRRRVPCLVGDVSERDLCLLWRDSGWYAFCRFLAVRTVSLDTKNPDSLNLENLTLESAIKIIKDAGYKVIKEI